MTKPLEIFDLAAKNRRPRYLDPNGCRACDDAAGCPTGVKVRLTATGECVGCLAVGRVSTPGPAVARGAGARNLPPDTIVSRADAKAKGWKVYRTGEECSRGHAGFRYVSSRACVECGRKDGATLDVASRAMVEDQPEAVFPLHLAVALGLAVYRTGEACPACGASSWRLVAGGDCLVCRGLI